MDLSRSRITWLAYGLGLAAPALIVGALMLIERAGARLPFGIAWVVLGSFMSCLLGAAFSGATLKRKIVLILVAAAVVPMELLILAFFFITSGGLSGTQ